ncbi:MAG: PIN domain-containing protein [Flavobacteriales bacterium]
MFQDEATTIRSSSTALTLQRQHKDRKVVLVSKDIALRLKAESLNIIAEDYLTGKVRDVRDAMYSGRTVLDDVDEAQMEQIVRAWAHAGGRAGPSAPLEERLPSLGTEGASGKYDHALLRPTMATAHVCASVKNASRARTPAMRGGQRRPGRQAPAGAGAGELLLAGLLLLNGLLTSAPRDLCRGPWCPQQQGHQVPARRYPEQARLRLQPLWDNLKLIEDPVREATARRSASSRCWRTRRSPSPRSPTSVAAA